MVAQADQNPLQKQIFSLDLSKGVNEAVRLENLSGQDSIYTLDNLVSVDDKSWVKRPGLTYLSGGTTDDNAGNLTTPLRVIRLLNGVGLIANQYFYQYSESFSSWRKKNLVPEWSVQGATVASSGPAPTSASANTTARIFASASSTKWDVVIVPGGVTTAGAPPTNSKFIMVVYDKNSGNEIVRYDLSAGASGYDNFGLAFISDRYLHVYINKTTGAAATVKVKQVDTNNGWPQPLSGYFNSGTTTVYTLAGKDFVIMDTAKSDANSMSYVLIQNVTDTRTIIASVSTALAVVTRGPITHMYQSIAPADTQGYLWAVGPAAGAATARVLSVPLSNVNGAAQADYTDGATAFGVTANISIAAYADGRIGVWQNDEGTYYGGVGQKYWETTSSAATALTLRGTINTWHLCVKPFYNSTTDKIYAVLQKSLNNTNTITNTNAIVCCLSDYVQTAWTTNPYSITSVRPCAVLEAYNAIFMQSRSTQQVSAVRAIPASATSISVPVMVQSTNYSAAVNVYTLTVNSPKTNNFSQLGPNTHVASGVVSKFDGYYLFENGFVDRPVLTVADSGGGTGPNGAYTYVAVFKHVSASGDVTYSQISEAKTVTVANHAVTVTLYGCHVNAKESGYTGENSIVIEVFRTIAGGTQLYRLTTSGISSGPVLGATDGTFTYTDSTTDATLQTNAVMYRQPLQANGPLDRFGPPGGYGVICTHKDRLFCADASGNRVFYSSFFVDGESPWFNSQFSFWVHGGSGPITALASMDGKLVVFKKDAIFVVDGDGPPENGGTGSELSPPNRIAANFGCIDQRSVVVCSDGLIFRSPRGFELLSRSFQLSYIGEPVNETNLSYPVCTGAAMDRYGVIWFLVSQTEVASASTSKALLYDTEDHVWSTATFKNYLGTSDVQSICSADILGSEKIIISDPNRMVAYLDETLGPDLGTYTSSTIETGWIRCASAQGNQRVSDVILLAKKASGNHKLTISVAYNYINSYTQVTTWEPNVINGLSLEELLVSISNQRAVAVRIKIQDAAPTDTGTYPVGAGRGFELLDVSVLAAPKTSIQKLQASQKG